MAFPSFSLSCQLQAPSIYAGKKHYWTFGKARPMRREKKIAACVFDLEAIEDVSSAIGCRRSVGRAIKLARSDVLREA